MITTATWAFFAALYLIIGLFAILTVRAFVAFVELMCHRRHELYRNRAAAEQVVREFRAAYPVQARRLLISTSPLSPEQHVDQFQRQRTAIRDELAVNSSKEINQ